METDETVNSLIIKYRKLAQKEYKTWNDWSGKVIHLELLKKKEDFYHKIGYMH